jgi:hypothetical protein
MYVVAYFSTGQPKVWEPLKAKTKIGALKEALKKGQLLRGKTIIVGWREGEGTVEELAFRDVSREDRWRHR